MQFTELMTLGYWNGLAQGHLPELVLILTAAMVTLADRHVRRLLNRMTASRGKIARFAAFLVVCSAGYAALGLVVFRLLWGIVPMIFQVSLE